MKIMLISLLISVSSLIYLQLSKTKMPGTAAAKAELLRYKKKFTVSCAVNPGSFDPTDSANDIPLLSGWGKYKMEVTTSSDSADIYFQQGINMYYAFHIIEALASFSKSIQFDSSFAMGYWGMALAYGPNINDFGYTASPEALVAKEKAKALAGHCTAVERTLIAAMQVRYTADTMQTREILNQLYVIAMKTAQEQFAANTDMAVLYADALMQQHPWDLYNSKGKPKAWTPLIVTTIEKALALDPSHPGAAHYYIHAIEASDHPEKALAAADRLPGLMPGVSHVVHMPAHIYIRSGYYKKGVEVDELAVKGYYDYLRKYPPVASNAPLYLLHNLHMQATCANMDGRFADAMKASIDARNSFDSSWLSLPDYMGIFIQYFYMTPWLTQTRFGKWDEMLKEPAVSPGYVYANLLWHYGRGLAFARKHNFEQAQQALNAVQAGLKSGQLKAPAPSYANPGINGALVAEKILLGVIAEEQNQFREATLQLKAAVSLEDSMIYNEPRDWVHPARQYLGSVLLKDKKFEEAAEAFKADLKINPNNGWSLTGLATALAKQGKKKESQAIAKRAAKAFERTDMPHPQPVF
ncbi:MAG: tetratricopeptide repeat protein [Chitinophagaceae bacterium]